MVWDRHRGLGDEGTVSHPTGAHSWFVDTSGEIHVPIESISSPVEPSCFHEPGGDVDITDEPNPERYPAPEPYSEQESSEDMSTFYQVIDDPDEWDDDDIDEDDFDIDPDISDDDDFDDDLDDDFDDE